MIFNQNQQKSALRQYDEIEGEDPEHFLCRFFSWTSSHWQEFPIYIRCGSQSLRRGRCHVFHYNYDKMALELTVSGTMHYRFGNREVLLRPGDIALLHHGSNSGFFNRDGDKCERLVLILEGKMRDQLVRALNLDQFEVLHTDDLPLYVALFRRIHEALAEKATGGEAEVSELSYHLLLALSKLLPDDRHGRLPEELENIIRFININLHRKIQVVDIAASAGMSPASVVRLFKKYLSVSPGAYILTLRMETAAGMLLAENISIKEVAWRCGFDNPLYFSSAFRRYKGVSPREFRRSGE